MDVLISPCGNVRARCAQNAARRNASLSHPFCCSTHPARRNGHRQFRVEAAASSPSVLQKMSRVIQEKGRDFGKLVSGTERTRAKLGVLEELFVLWNLEDADDELEELEDALIMADFGPTTAFKIVDQIRDKVQSGDLKTVRRCRRGPRLRRSLLTLMCFFFSARDLKFGTI